MLVVAAAAAIKWDLLAQAAVMAVMVLLRLLQPQQTLAAAAVVHLIQVDSQRLQVVQA
jgi:hypothetical protein